MLADQLTAAAAGARTMTQLDELARLTWRALAEGHLDEASAQASGEAVEARRQAIKGQRALSQLPSPNAPAKPAKCISPDRRKSLERRRRCATSGAVPSTIAAAFTLGELAVLAVVAGEVKRRGRCDWPIDRIAAIAGVSRTTTQNALREAGRLGLVSVTERRRAGRRSDTNLVEITSEAWRSWLRLTGFRNPDATKKGNSMKKMLWIPRDTDRRSGSVPAIQRQDEADRWCRLDAGNRNGLRPSSRSSRPRGS